MIAKVLLLAALISVSIAVILEQSADDNRDFISNTKRLTIVIFVSSQCDYSTRILAEYKKAEKEFKNNNIDWVLVTCDQDGNKPTCQRYEVRSYPQIGAFNNGVWQGIMPNKRGKSPAIVSWVKSLSE